MAPRTRASRAGAAETVAPLAVAPRRRVKVTQLDTETKPSTRTKEAAVAASASALVVDSKPATRSSRSKKSEATVGPTVDTKSTRTKTAAVSSSAASAPTTRSRGTRSKKTEQSEVSTVPDDEDAEKTVEPSNEKPKRTTRATRATAPTKSSEAREKPTARPTRKTTQTTKKIAKPSQIDDEHAMDKDEDQEGTTALAKRTAPKKKVTFQDLVDNKENQSVAIKPKSTKTSTKSLGLKAKPVRKAATTRASKRSHDQLSDNEAEAPKKKIQRVLTPKKITQMSNHSSPQASPDQEEPEIIPSPSRPLTASPIRRQITVMADIDSGNRDTKASTSKPMQDANQLLFGNSAHRSAVQPGVAHLQSPARRPIVPSGRLFSSAKPSAVTDLLAETSVAGMASPARRPLDSPAKLLFPTSNQPSKNAASAIEKGHLFQSPKRSHVMDPSRMFPQSATKPNKPALSKSNFFSSPAKRSALLSPRKPLETVDSSDDEPDDNDSSLAADHVFDDLHVAQLLEDPMEEVVATSYQRASVSPVRPIKVTEEEMELDFDQSILPVGSPLKVNRSPLKLTPSPRKAPTVPLSIAPVLRLSAETEVATSLSLQNTEHANNDNVMCDTQGVAEQRPVVLTESSAVELQDVTEVYEASIESPAVAIAQEESSSTPQTVQTDAIQGFIQSPPSPAALHEHELTLAGQQLVQSSPACGESGKNVLVSNQEMMGDEQMVDVQDAVSEDCESIISEREGLLSQLNTPNTTKVCPVSPAEIGSSPALLSEHEITRIGTRFEDETVHARSRTPASPASLDEHELTTIGVAFTPQPQKASSTLSSPLHVDSAHKDTHEAETQDVTTTPSASPNISNNNVLDESTREDLNDCAATATPVAPVPRKFNLHTIVSKVPLKPAAEESPVPFTMNKRRRHLSLGGQPKSLPVDLRQESLVKHRSKGDTQNEGQVATVASTPKQQPATNQRASTGIAIKKSNRVVSTPASKEPLSKVTRSTILAGVVAYVDVHTTEGADASAIYHDLLIHLGARCLREWKDHITHVVFKDGNPKILERARLSDKDVKIVGLSWPLDCDEQQSWVDEKDYLLDPSPIDRILCSMGKRARRKSMEPSTLVANGSGSVKRSRSRSRSRVSVTSTVGLKRQASVPPESTEIPASEDPATPLQDVTHKYAALAQNSMTTAWKSLNATCNLGDDTPARKTMELLQKSYEMERAWDDTLDMTDNEDQENIPTPASRTVQSDGDDTEIIETGLTPAPYRVATQVGSAPAKVINAGMTSYRERVEEMERRETRDAALGTNKGARGKGKNRMTMYGSGLAFEPAHSSPLRD